MRAAIKTLGVVAALSAGAAAQTSNEGVYYRTSAVLAIASEYIGTRSLAPSQVSQLYDDINAYATEWISAFPTNDPAFTDPVFTKTDSSIVALFTAIESADGDIIASGTQGVAELSALVTGLPDASAYLAYASTLQAAASTWTNVISQIVVTDVGKAPTQTSTSASSTGSSKSSSSSKGSGTLTTKTANSQTTAGTSATNSASSSTSSAMAAAPTSGSGVVIGAVAAAAGVIGAALL